MFVQLIVILVILVPILAIVLDSDIGKALASRLGDRRLDAGDDIVTERVGYLEGEVDRLSSELMRLDEQSQFLQKLLSDRPAADARILPAEAPTLPTDAPALPSGDDPAQP